MSPFVGFPNPLTPVENVLGSVLEWFHATLGLSWAWSIVAVVLCVRVLLVPVSVKQIHSMQNLQIHAPEMKAIQQKWKHDRQRQNKELMAFYGEKKINPAASCLPIVLQIPIFIALFYVLKDFETEILPRFPDSTLEFLGLVKITDTTMQGWGPLLLVVYVVSQLTSSYLMSGTMQKAQRILLLVLPVLFTPFILNFDSGLMVYWLTTNLWTTGQGLVTRRMIPKPDPEALKRIANAPAVESEPANKASSRPKSEGSGPIQGPPRRVKRKRAGGGGRR